MEKAAKVPFDEIKQVKETLADNALEQLKMGSDLDKLENIEVEFGYIYMRNDGLEALFKVVTDRKSIFFAAQQGKLMRLQENFNDELFQRTIQQMEEIHGEWR
ncbi:MAG: hypothetical protein RLN81_11445 [Balneolaceae bacterium]